MKGQRTPVLGFVFCDWFLQSQPVIPISSNPAYAGTLPDVGVTDSSTFVFYLCAWLSLESSRLGFNYYSDVRKNS